MIYTRPHVTLLDMVDQKVSGLFDDLVTYGQAQGVGSYTGYDNTKPFRFGIAMLVTEDDVFITLSFDFDEKQKHSAKCHYSRKYSRVVLKENLNFFNVNIVFAVYILDYIQGLDVVNNGLPQTLYPSTLTNFRFQGYTQGQSTETTLDRPLTLKVIPTPMSVYSFDSSNPAVATIDQNGLVSPVGFGTTTITAGPFAQAVNATLELILSVIAYTVTESPFIRPLGTVAPIPISPSPPEPERDFVTDESGNIMMTEDGQIIMSEYKNPWTVADPSIVSIDAFGNITFLAIGTTTITGKGISVIVETIA